MNNYIWIWLGAAVFFGIVEALTMSLTSIWFVGGALAALAAAALGGKLWLQITVFIIVSAVLLVFTRPVISKYLKVGKEKTNIDSVIGRQAVVIQEINNIQGSGQVKVGGLIWSACSDDQTVIPAGRMVEITRVVGVRAYVRPLAEQPAASAEIS